MESKFDDQFSSQCPYCEGTGTPQEMTVRDYERTIRFVCGSCLRTWIVGEPGSAPRMVSPPSRADG